MRGRGQFCLVRFFVTPEILGLPLFQNGVHAFGIAFKEGGVVIDSLHSSYWAACGLKATAALTVPVLLAEVVLDCENRGPNQTDGSH